MKSGSASIVDRFVKFEWLKRFLELPHGIPSQNAEGCRSDIAKKIRDKNADYAPAVKGNQPGLPEQTQDFFDVVTNKNIAEPWLEKYDDVDK